MDEKSSAEGQPEQTEQPGPMKFAEFLESVPPNQQREIADLASIGTILRGNLVSGYSLSLATPDIHLHCSSMQCNGLRFFRCDSHDAITTGKKSSENIFLKYVCSNCRASTKQFALRTSHSGKQEYNGNAFKFGELPAFGPPTPQRLLKLLENQRQNFLAGRRCENQGLGIGAFAYYRRVVEHQKGRILEEITKVAEMLNASPGTLDLFAQAQAETQFSKSIDLVKNAIPQSLLIQGHHNPLTLLHSALSKGLHAESDESCLDLAQSIRLVLAELAERLSTALKNDAELNAAVSRLLRNDGPEKSPK
ncbi:MAG TPA: hypothetical protein VKS24_11120 [Bradyrhizobium sp.]|nr:hypothetical protein [Bradyrhizobium sp.]